MTFKLCVGRYAICRLEAAAGLPSWAASGLFSSITRTPEELSIICEAARVPVEVKAEKGYCALQVVGPLDFEAVGIMESFLAPLAKARIPIFAVSTYDTDWILVHEKHLERAVSALAEAGHQQSR